jgi:hypothetical protein
MSKGTYYFSHDYNARNDRKMVNIIMKHGMSGVGVYWCVVEMLYEEGGYLPFEYERISFELRTTKEIVQSVISDFELFKFTDITFYSESVLDRLQQRKDKSEKARISIDKRWNKLSKDTNVIRPLPERITIKERKGKEIKEKKVFIIPTLEEIKKYCHEIKSKVDPQYFLDYQITRDWKLKGGQPIKDWHAAIRTWSKNNFDTGGVNGNKFNTYQRNNRELSKDESDAYDAITREYEATKTSSVMFDN